MLKVENLHAGYGEISVLRGIDLHVTQGQVVSLLGANGAGKSTLLRTLTGLIPAASGSIEFKGEQIGNLRAHEIVERGLVMVPEGRSLFPFMTVEENFLVGAYAHRAREKMSVTLDRVYSLLPKMYERRNQRSGSMSGGEQQMCAIGRALMTQPELLLMDEPSLGLAPIVVKEIFRIVERLRNEGITILLVEQHVKNALAIANEGYVLEGGRITVSGPSSDLLANPHLRNAYMGTNH